MLEFHSISPVLGIKILENEDHWSELDTVNQDSNYNSTNFHYSLVITLLVIYHKVHLAFRRLDLLENDCELCEI